MAAGGDHTIPISRGYARRETLGPIHATAGPSQKRGATNAARFVLRAAPFTARSKGGPFG